MNICCPIHGRMRPVHGAVPKETASPMALTCAPWLISRMERQSMGKSVSCGCAVQAVGIPMPFLPDVIIPYSVYGLFFILRVLAEYFLRLHTVEKLCSRFGISVSMLYRFKDLFLSHKQQWLGMLVSAETAPSTFIKSLCFLEQYSVSFAGSVSIRYSMMADADFPKGSENTQSSLTLDTVMEFWKRFFSEVRM